TNPRNQPTDFPCFGAAVQYLRPGRAGLPGGISLNAPANQVSANNHIFPGFFAGILGSTYDPLFIAQDPSAPGFRSLPAAEVEAGVGLVTVNWARDDAFWDTHANNFRDLKTKLLPPFDLGFSALLEDLEGRGLLGETLVVCLGEFGRTPAVNRNAGRDHWAAC